MKMVSMTKNRLSRSNCCLDPQQIEQHAALSRHLEALLLETTPNLIKALLMIALLLLIHIQSCTSTLFLQPVSLTNLTTFRTVNCQEKTESLMKCSQKEVNRFAHSPCFLHYLPTNWCYVGTLENCSYCSYLQKER